MIINIINFDLCDAGKGVLPTDPAGAFLVQVTGLVPGLSGKLYFRVNSNINPPPNANVKFRATILSPLQYSFSVPAFSPGDPIFVSVSASVIEWTNQPVVDGVNYYLPFAISNLVSVAFANPTDVLLEVMDMANTAVVLDNTRLTIRVHL
jgi:hypothetical protein